jgi:hypothetical protein
MRIGVDIMEAITARMYPPGARCMAARELPADVRIVLIGDARAHRLRDCSPRPVLIPARFDVVPSADDITMKR